MYGVVNGELFENVKIWKFGNCGISGLLPTTLPKRSPKRSGQAPYNSKILSDFPSPEEVPEEIGTGGTGSTEAGSLLTREQSAKPFSNFQISKFSNCLIVDIVITLS